MSDEARATIHPKSAESNSVAGIGKIQLSPDKKTLLVKDNGTLRLGLPVSTYWVKLSGRMVEIETKDGQVVEFDVGPTTSRRGHIEYATQVVLALSMSEPLRGGGARQYCAA